MKHLLVSSLIFGSVIACAHRSEAPTEEVPIATASLQPAEGSTMLATASFVEEPEVVRMVLNVRMATEGEYDVRITSTPKTCAEPDAAQADSAALAIGPLVVDQSGMGQIEAILKKDATTNGIDSLQQHAVVITEEGERSPEACGEVKKEG